MKVRTLCLMLQAIVLAFAADNSIPFSTLPKTVEEQWLFCNNNYVKGCIYLYVSPLYCGVFVLFSMTISILSTLMH